MKKLLIIIAIAALPLLFTACSSGTRITSSWKSPDAPSSAAAYRKVMVVALLSDKDRSLQQAMETELMNELTAKGIAAASAYQTYGPRSFNNENQAKRQLRNSGADAIMTIVLLDKTKEKNYVPGNVTYQPWGPYYSRFWGYYRYSYDRIYTPGYYTTNTSYFWESNLYELRNNKLVYSVQTESFDPSSAESLSKEYSRKIVENMMKQGVLLNK
jgi:hypothetical protein